MAGAVSVRGYRELNRALARASKEVRAEVRESLKQVAVPVASTAERLASTEIRRIGPKWPQMRIGVTSKLIYVAPKQRGRLTKRMPTRYARPNLANLLMDEAMDPALDIHRPLLDRYVNKALDKMEDVFDRGI